MEQKNKSSLDTGRKPAEEKTEKIAAQTPPAAEKEDNDPTATEEAIPAEKEPDVPAAEEKEDHDIAEPDGAKDAAKEKEDAAGKTSSGGKPAAGKPGAKQAAAKTKSGEAARKKPVAAPARQKTGATPGKKSGASGAGPNAKTGARKPGAAAAKKRPPEARYRGRPAVEDSRSERVRISAERRRRKKRRRDAFIVFVALLMMGAILVILSTTVFFKASKIVVNNTEGRYTDERIAEASGLRAGENMFTADLKKAADAIERQLPYIRVATVGRKWPETFTIDTEYAEMILAVRKGNAYVYTDVDGKVLETDVSAPDATAAIVTGVFAEEAVPGEAVVLAEGASADTLIGIARGLYEGGVRKVTGINLENPTDVVVELDHRIEVRFGPVSSFADRIEFGKTVIEKNMKEGSRQQLVIDLTTEAKAFVREKQDPSKLPATESDAEPATPTEAAAQEETGGGREEGGADDDYYVEENDGYGEDNGYAEDEEGYDEGYDEGYYEGDGEGYSDGSDEDYVEEWG